MSLKNLFYNNSIIVKTLFHINDSCIKVIDDKTRLITKNYKTSKLFLFMPLLKELLEELIKDINTIKLLITETFDSKLNGFTYEIKLAENKLFENITNLYNFKYYIHLNLDKINNKKINSHLSMDKNNIYDDFNPVNNIIIMIILNYFENEHPNYYKKVVLEDQLKPLLNLHSFELNII